MKKIDLLINKLLKLSIYKKIVIIYFTLLIVFSMIFLLYIKSCLIFYENNQTQTFINNYIDEIASASKKGNLKKYVDLSNIKISSLENKKTSIDKAFYKFLKNSKITYEIKSINDKKAITTYTLFADLKPILEIDVKKGDSITRLGLLNFNLLSVNKVRSIINNGLYYYDINIPSNYKILINDVLLTDKYISSNDNNDEFNNESYGIVPVNNVYEINNLLYKPEIIIKDEHNKEISYEIKKNIITIKNTNEVLSEKDAMKKLITSFDVLSFAKKWSLFLTNDLNGSLRGFRTLEEYLIKDSLMWDRAYDWATGIDITFVSKHTFKNPMFTNEKVDKCVVYNEKAFSCEVHLEKNMIVLGKTKVDVMNDRLYFIYYDNSLDNINNPKWKIVNMKTITKE